MKIIKARLGDVTEIINGTTPKSEKPEYWNGELVWVTPTDLGQLEVDHISQSGRRITESGKRSCSLKTIPEGAIVMSSRAPIGHLAIAGCELHTNQGCKSFICSERLNNIYLYYYLKFVMADIQSLGSGATFTEVSKKILDNFEIAFPEDVVQQAEIAEQIKALFTKVKEAKKAAQLQLKELELIPQKILARVFDHATP